MKKKQIDYIKIIEDCGLVHASSRKLPLFSVSSIFFAYIMLLKKHAGYSYENIAAIGRGDETRFLINEEKVGDAFAKTVGSRNLARAFEKFKDLFQKNKKRIELVRNEKDQFKVLKTISEVYPDVFSQIGFYNSIMRYVENDAKRASELGEAGLLAGKDKDIVADFIYQDVEGLLKDCVDEIGRANNFEGDLLRYMTLNEIKSFIKEKNVPKEMLAELSRRREGYLYIDCGNKEYILSDKNIVDLARKRFIDATGTEVIIKGASAYPGKVTGKVQNLFHSARNLNPGSVLVTNITKPEDTPFLKKAVAIVTDEGGLLSHIAIVARELKIPVVMSTKIATKVLKDGDIVEVDADKGIVRKINSG